MDKKGKEGWKIFSLKTLAIFIITVILISATYYAIYFLFFSEKECKNEECFLQGLWKCKRVSFISEKENAAWHYSIKGKTKDACKVDVTALDVNAEEKTALALQGKSMSCLVPKETVYMPEEKLEYCNGLLKEAIQDIIIERMHLYIVQNIGIINKSITKGI